MGRRSRSRSRSDSRERRRRSRSRSSSPDDDGYRLHVGDLGIDCSRKEIEKTFEKFGPLMEVWLARNPPCFAFVVYRHKEDADEAMRDLNGQVVCGSRVKISYALPRSRGRRVQSFDPNLRCYTCGERGHFSRDCDEIWKNKSGYCASFRRSFSRSRSRSRDRGRRSRSRDRRRRSRSRDRRRRSRSRSRDRGRRSRSRDRKRSPSRSRSRERTRRSRSKDKKEKRRALVPDYDEGHEK